MFFSKIRFSKCEAAQGEFDICWGEFAGGMPRQVNQETEQLLNHWLTSCTKGHIKDTLDGMLTYTYLHKVEKKYRKTPRFNKHVTHFSVCSVQGNPRETISKRCQAALDAACSTRLFISIWRSKLMLMTTKRYFVGILGEGYNYNHSTCTVRKGCISVGILSPSVSYLVRLIEVLFNFTIKETAKTTNLPKCIGPSKYIYQDPVQENMCDKLAIQKLTFSISMLLRVVKHSRLLGSCGMAQEVMK